MNQFKKIIFTCLLGLTAPALFGLVAILIWFFISKNETVAPYYLIIGICIGMLIDLLFLKKWVKNLYSLPYPYLAMLLIFYHFLIYGFFMGFPGFNLILAIITGYYIGLRYQDQDLDEQSKSKLLQSIPLFSAGIMLVLCCFTIFLVFKETSIGNEIQNMFKLKIEISVAGVRIFTLFGSVFLIFSQYYLTHVVMKKYFYNAR